MRLAAHDLACGYPGKEVLSGLNLAIESGESIGLLGPNGGGKSTLLRTLVGLLPPQQGRLEAPADRARTFAWVPQEEQAAFDYTVSEVVALGRLPYATGFWESESDQQIVHESLAQVGLGALSTAVFSQLSGGQKQRVLIARALAQRTPILALDEPFSHQDLGQQAHLIQALMAWRKGDRILLLSSHDINPLVELCDRVWLVRQGQVLDAGSPLDQNFGVHLEALYGVRLHFLKTERGHPRWVLG